VTNSTLGYNYLQPSPQFYSIWPAAITQQTDTHLTHLSTGWLPRDYGL